MKGTWWTYKTVEEKARTMVLMTSEPYKDNDGVEIINTLHYSVSSLGIRTMKDIEVLQYITSSSKFRQSTVKDMCDFIVRIFQ